MALGAELHKLCRLDAEIDKQHRQRADLARPLVLLRVEPCQYGLQHEHPEAMIYIKRTGLYIGRAIYRPRYIYAAPRKTGLRQDGLEGAVCKRRYIYRLGLRQDGLAAAVYKRRYFYRVACGRKALRSSSRDSSAAASTSPCILVLADIFGSCQNNKPTEIAASGSLAQRCEAPRQMVDAIRADDTHNDNAGYPLDPTETVLFGNP